MSEKERWVVALAKGHLNQLKGVFYEEGLACVECERSASSTVRLCGFSAKATERDPSPSFWDDLTRNLTWHSRVAEAQKRERIEQELRVARQIQRSLLPEATSTTSWSWRTDAWGW